MRLKGKSAVKSHTQIYQMSAVIQYLIIPFDIQSSLRLVIVQMEGTDLNFSRVSIKEAFLVVF